MADIDDELREPEEVPPPSAEERRAMRKEALAFFEKAVGRPFACPGCGGTDSFVGADDAAIMMISNRKTEDLDKFGFHGSIHLALVPCQRCGFTSLFDWLVLDPDDAAGGEK